MRMFLGFILGILLTIGAAYITDSVRKTDGPEGSVERPVVNWDVVERGVKALTSSIQDSWTRLTGRGKDL
ncbi:hypothetical protein RZS28_04525 [Methylocapsa polymorpha]|uniref:Uncharacterized protein n=1 Tax=Methylocapsa polymorpha TaxID=3080828 RepID=A0ABZ0HTD4_9HYPH|nr:hypothetical protein RZS28_04525 [Methylocapsa sp. RX1]